ncbi:MAG: hypothetical protein ACKVN9_00545 [Methylophilaceae bacterium]
MKVLLAVLLLSLSTFAAAKDELPLNEHGFVDAVKTMKTDKIAALLGKPARHYELKDDRTGAVIGQVWQYEYLNTNETGEYYPTTELDIIDNQVATVVFMNENSPNPDYVEPTQVEEVLPECNPSC